MMPSFVQSLWTALWQDAPLVQAPFFLIGIASLMLWPGDLLIPRDQKRRWSLFTQIILGITLYLVVVTPHRSGFSNMFRIDTMTQAFQLICTVATLATVVLSKKLLDLMNEHTVEFYTLLLFTLSGMLLLCGATDLVTLYFSIELMALPIYVLVGYFRDQERGIEAGVKYFLLGAFSSGIMIYGISLLYGATGGTTTNFEGLSTALVAAMDARGTMVTLGVLMVLVGMAFKVAVVPFHMWTPDVYDGAPTPITAFMASAPKAAAIFAFAKVFGVAFHNIPNVWTFGMEYMAAASMILGNVAALRQQSMKRMLAYSSIAHVGYMMLAILSNDPNLSIRSFSGVQSLWLYIFAYLFMNFGAFAIITFLQGKGEGERIDDFRGLSQRNPWLAFAMMLFLLSLAGIPPLIGFFSKFILFKMALERGFVVLTVIAVLTSAVSAYYYLGVINQMYFRSSTGKDSLKMDRMTGVLVSVCALMVLLGVSASGWLIDIVDKIKL
ncbi:MAG: NADH-quinone oxidoreductase subunit N [Holophagaceae bacterium]|jgi:NADH-quinone oxidoreductase subunit N